MAVKQRSKNQPASKTGTASESAAGESSDFWTPTREVALFRALIPRKVAGPLKHFHMAAVLHDIDKNHSCKFQKQRNAIRNF